MFIKKSVDKNHYKNNGYVIIDTDLEYNKNFNDLIDQIDNDLRFKIKNDELKKNGGFIMGNFGINQGPYGPKLKSLIFKEQFVKIFEDLTEVKLDSFDIFCGGNLVLPKKGKQHFHIDGSYDKKMYMISIVTENIDLSNGPTEICVGSQKKEMKFWEFFFSKKQKKKIILKKGQILIRPHNLWHRGTKNFSNKTRLLLSFVMTPKVDKGKKIEPISSELMILPNFFKSNFQGKLHELFYIHFGSIRTILKLLISFIKQK
jgi:hypothetical protein